ncbi:MAG: DUF3021 domain-containing protein [Lachnospiraceae bacterium]|nr:DUF3021 domain-containing protein [Lachnospiraceae bacterium]
MDKLKAKTAILILAGIVIGFSIVVIIYMCGGYPMEMLADRPAFLAQIIGSCLLGAVNMGATIVYDIDKWGIIRVTLTHYFISMCSFIICEKLLGWFPDSVLFIVIAIFTVVYALIWIIMSLRGKKEVMRMNEELEALQRKDREESDQ